MKKLYLAIILLLTCANYSDAQLLGSIKVQPSDMMELSNVKDSEASRIIEKAVRPGLFIVKRSFQLQDKNSKELFGLNGRPEFGIEYSVGVKTPSGFCVTNQALRPWTYNNSFKKYEEKYIPVISKSEYLELNNDSAFLETAELEKEKSILCDSAIYRYESGLFQGQSFKIDTVGGKKKGWLILVTHSKNTDISDLSNLSFLCQEKELLVNKTICNDSLVGIPSDVMILGGVYVIPEFKGIGEIEFHLCGILSKVDNQWKVYFPFLKKEDNTDLSEDEKIAEDKEGKDELTPVDKKSKSKKRK